MMTRWPADIYPSLIGGLYHDDEEASRYLPISDWRSDDEEASRMMTRRPADIYPSLIGGLYHDDEEASRYLPISDWRSLP